MSERTFNPKFIPITATKTLLIEMGEDNYLRMSSDVAREFGMRIVAAAAKAEGKTGHAVFMEVPA